MTNEVLSYINAFFGKYEAIVIAVIAALGVFFTAWAALRNNSKNILVKTVTDERARWRVDLRNSYAEFAKLVYEQMSNQSADNTSRIVELKAHIRLRTNPSCDPKHILDQNIISSSQEIVELLEKNAEKNAIAEKLQFLELNIQNLLKQEWDKSKGEAVSGKLAK